MPGSVSVYSWYLSYNGNTGFIIALTIGLIVGFVYDRWNCGL